MHPKFGDNSETRSFAHFIKIPIFKAVLMQINFSFSEIISSKVAYFSVCYLTNGYYIMCLLEKHTRENKVIAAVEEWTCFQFYLK